MRHLFVSSNDVFFLVNIFHFSFLFEQDAMVTAVGMEGVLVMLHEKPDHNAEALPSNYNSEVNKCLERERTTARKATLLGRTVFRLVKQNKIVCDSHAVF